MNKFNLKALLFLVIGGGLTLVGGQLVNKGNETQTDEHTRELIREELKKQNEEA